MKTLTRALALLLLLTASVMGQTYYVDASATAGGDGLTPETAFDTLADAEAVLTDGPQTIMLKAGSTFTAQTLRLTNNDTVMRYGFGANPIIDGTGAVRNDCMDCIDGKNILVQDVWLTGGTSHGWQVNGSAENVVLRRVKSYSNSINGFAHDNSSGTDPEGSGRVWYIDCWADANSSDGFNNRGYARDVCIRCKATNHTDVNSDGWTTHGSSAFEIWYCTGDGNTNDVHFTHGDFGNAYCKIWGCQFANATAISLNLQGSEVGGGIWYTTIETDAQAIATAPVLQEQIIDGCQFIATSDSDWGFFIDGGNGTAGVVIRNCFFRMPANTTQSSCYAIRQTGTGVIKAYNNTFVCPPDATETSNYFTIYAVGGTTSQVVNNFFLKTDEPNAYFIRGATNWTQYDLVDGNVHLQVTTNNDNWYEGSGAISFATFQADNLGNGGTASDATGAALVSNPATRDADYLGTIEDFRIRPLTYAVYGLALNCVTAADVTSKFCTAFGNEGGPAIRDGSTNGTWTAGPHAQTVNQNGSVSRIGDRTVFNHATQNGSWTSSFKLTDGPHIKGDFTKRHGFSYLQIQATAATEVFIHAGEFGLGEDILWTGQTGTVLPLVVNFKDAPIWGPPGKDLYVSFVGSGVLSGEITAMQGSVKESTSGGVPKIDLRPARKANSTVR